MKTIPGILSILLLLGTVAFSKAAEVTPLTVLNQPEIFSATANEDSTGPVYSADGRFIVFVSSASNLVTNDFNKHADVFIANVATRQIRLVSANTNNTSSGNAPSYNPRVSSDGQYVVFESSASDLVIGDTNRATDIFMRNLANDSMLRISGFERTGPLGIGNAANPVISTNARRIVFESSATNQSLMDTNGKLDVIMYDWSVHPPLTRLMSTISNANATASARGESTQPLISPDGRWLVFTSRIGNGATNNNVAFNNLNYSTDLYVRDLQTNLTRMIRPATTNLPVAGFSILTSSHVISANSKALAFRATPNAHLKGTVYYYVLATQSIRMLTTNALTAETAFGGDTCGPIISADGNRVVYVDAKGAVYMFNAANGSTIRIPGAHAQDTNSFSPIISPDGFKVMLYNDTLGWCLTNLNGGGFTASVLNDNSFVTVPVFSPDSRHFAFSSMDPGFVTNDLNRANDIFIHELSSSQKTLVTAPHTDQRMVTLNGHTVIGPNAIATNNSRVVFTSWSGNIVANDTNNVADVFVKDTATGDIQLVSVNSAGLFSGNGISRNPVISANGRYVAFTSTATNLVISDANLAQDVFLRDLEQGTTVAVSRTPAGATGNRHSLNPSISGDGKYVVYQSYAGNLVATGDGDTTRDTFLYDRETGVNQIISIGVTPANIATNTEVAPLISTAGTDVVYVEGGLYHYNIASNALLRVVNTVSTNRNFLAMGRNSDQVLYRSQTAYGLRSYDLRTTANYLIYAFSEGGNLDGRRSQLQTSASADGRFIVYVTRNAAHNIVRLRDLMQNEPVIVSRALTGDQNGNGSSDSPAISANGRFVVFRSYATNLVEGDTNGQPDIFLRDMQLGVTTRLNSGNYGASQPYISDDGTLVVFNSESTGIAPGDANGLQDTYAVRLTVNNTPDSDSDGLEDAWEVANFGNLSRDGTEDADGDGASDAHEFFSGTDPKNQNSVFEGQLIQPTSEGVVRITWPAVAGKTYRVQYKNALTDANWTNVTASAVITGNTGSLEDVPPAGTVQRYYRVVIE